MVIRFYDKHMMCGGYYINILILINYVNTILLDNTSVI